MRTCFLLSLLLAPLAASLSACDSIHTGQLSDDNSPLTLVKIMIQDERPGSGLFSATDLLEVNPMQKCSETEPCPSGNEAAGVCQIAMGQTEGTCSDPLDPRETPPAINVPAFCGGIQIRLVFNKILDGDAVEKVDVDPMTQASTWTLNAGVMELDDPSGMEVAFDPSILGNMTTSGTSGKSCSKYYDAGGSPFETSSIFFDPYGPALVFKPKEQLLPGTQYTIKIDPSKIKNRAGLTLTNDIHGAVQNTYTFTTEGTVYPLPGFGTPDPSDVAKNQAVFVPVTAALDPKSVGGTVTGPDGMPVPAEIFVDVGTDKTACAPIPQIDIVPGANGMAGSWPKAGDYTATIHGNAANSDKVPLKNGNTAGSGDVMIMFTVTDRTVMASDMDPNDVATVVFPETCMM